jgi:O-acetyl-ADP-ribose deacetylase (regulator of RNase III)
MKEMPITYKTGDIFAEDVQVLVNPVNCEGISGAGLALEFKKRFPANNVYLQKLGKEGRLQIGTICYYTLYNTLSGDVNRIVIANFPTKIKWKDASKLEWIEAGLKALAYTIVRERSVAIPALGCGLGGLIWQDVKLLIDKHMNLPEVNVVVFEPWPIKL